MLVFIVNMFSKVSENKMEIVSIFETNKNQENAIAMAKYLKDQFAFLGIKKPLRSSLQKDFLTKISKEKQIDNELVRFLWQKDEREYQYLAIDYLIKNKKKLLKKDFDLIKEIIQDKSWWDCVDIIASQCVGHLCNQYPELIDEHIILWSTDDDLWLRRTAILFQLKYKDKTDLALLEKIIKQNLNDKKEFFIDKAIGWILREYSKTDPNWVREFIAKHSMSNLTKREASKYL